MDNKIFSLLDPFLSYIDKGDFFRKPMGWLYLILAGLNVLFPLWIIVDAVNGGLFDASGKYIFAFILFWLVLCAAGAVSFLIWFNRKKSVESASKSGDQYLSTPAFTHFVQTVGEWAGSYIAIVGFVGGLLAWLFLGDEVSGLYRSIGLDFIEPGIPGMIKSVISGFVVILFTRFAAEVFRAIVETAMNTKK